jgi:hypothetical protein
MKTHQLLVKFNSGLSGWILFFVLLPIAAFGQTVSIEEGTDRMGGDYKSFELAGAQPALCQQACASDPACKAYSYVKPGVKSRRAVCFLKSSVPPPNASECCTSGARAAGGRPGPIIIPPGPPPPSDPEAEFVIPAPSTATAVSSLLEQEVHDIQWSWNAIGCFPGKAGSVPKPCPFVKDIAGFRIYSTEGGLLKTTTVPAERSAALGKQFGKCYFVTAFKGEDESGPSPIACVDAPPKPLFKISSAIQTPGTLRMAKNAAECVAASGGFGFLCDAVLKSNAQILLWEHSGGGIDGFRLYDAVNGTPLVVKTEANRNIRLFAVQPVKGVNVSDFCFTVRAYKGDTESLSSNPVCLTPKGPAPAPVKPLLMIGPSSGIWTFGVNLLRNQNNGCPLPRKYNEIRIKGSRVDAKAIDAMAIFWIHRDFSLCGKRSAQWSEGSIEFPLDAIPADFKSVELRFTSKDSLAFLNTDGPQKSKQKPTFNASCIQSIHAYNITLRDNSHRESYQIGEPDAWFSWIRKELLATETLPHTTYRLDVTAAVKRSLAAHEPKLGFVFEVDKNMVGNNDMCAMSFEGFALEVKQK